MAENTLTTKQLALLFDEIAAAAVHAERLCSHVPGGETDADYLATVIEVLRDGFRRVGWMADRGSMATGGVPMSGETDAWLMSPAWNELAEKVKGAANA